MGASSKIDPRTALSLYRVCRKGLKDTYEILTSTELLIASRETLEELIEEAIDILEQVREDLGE